MHAASLRWQMYLVRNASTPRRNQGARSVSLHDYNIARRLDVDGTPCTALLLGAMLRADPTTRARIAQAFPEIGDELRKRQQAVGGRLQSEHDWDEFEASGR